MLLQTEVYSIKYHLPLFYILVQFHYYSLKILIRNPWFMARMVEMVVGVARTVFVGSVG